MLLKGLCWNRCRTLWIHSSVEARPQIKEPCFIRKRRRSIIDIGYGSYCNSFTEDQKHKKIVPEYI